MDAEEYRRKAQDFLTLARQITDPQDRAKLVRMAAFWKERADEAEQGRAYSTAEAAQERAKGETFLIQPQALLGL